MTFSQKVWNLCKKIPKGRVTTYKEIGRALGGKGQVYRAVGAALNKTPYSPKVPCHRVVKSTGHVGGFARGVKKKVAMLKSEGIIVKGSRIDLTSYLFKFTKE